MFPGFSPLRLITLISFLLMASRVASAQPGPQYAEEPTGGVELPATALAGEHDALSTVVNPAGLSFIGGGSLSLALSMADEDRASSAGPGFGIYYGQTLGGGGNMPRLGFGIATEFLSPSRRNLVPDPGSPTRLTLATSLGAGNFALGLAWHRFFDDPGRSLDDVASIDIGLSTRMGSHWAAGFVARDVNAPNVASAPVQRRYELELVSRPVGTDAIELGFGGRVGEVRGDVDGWLRWSARLTRGLYLKGQVETRSLNLIPASISGDPGSVSAREYRVAVGFEISFGSVGAATYGTGVLDSDRATRLSSGTLVVRAGAPVIPSALAPRKRIERVELSGALSSRAHTALVTRLRAIGRDAAVVAVFVQLDGYGAGWATTQELHDELLRLRRAGKKVYAYMVTGSTREYFLASAANKVYLDPAGGIRLAGFAGTSLYFKGLFDKLGVNAQFEKIEEYKSAPEQFTRSGPTAPAMHMRNALYDSIYGHMIARIAKARGLSRARVKQLIDGGPYVAGDLRGKSDLVDAVVTADELGVVLAKELGAVYPVGGRTRPRPARWSYPSIAVIHIAGDIVDGKSTTIPLLGRKLVGSDTIVSALTAAREDSRIKAVVLRIDSPGGSAVASEMMAREVFKLRGVKPIICSMGDVAASGGYFAAAGCDVIFAEPTTITGSIGIFYGKFDLSALLGRMGLSWMTYKRGKRADTESYFRPYTDKERVFIKSKLRYMYGRFTKAVSEGRGMSQKAVDAVGRGRVWSGADAKRVKLVDRFGGVGDAIEYAKQRAGLGSGQRARVLLWPTPSSSLIGRLLGIPGLRARADGARPALGWLPGGTAVLQALPASVLANPGTVQARLPFTVIWQ